MDGLVQEMLVEFEEPSRTLVRQVARLQPNTAIEFPAELNGTEARGDAYWVPPSEGEGRYDVDQLVVELEVLLDRALNRCLRDAPFAVSLSGGIDSTVLWGLLAHRIRQGDPVAAHGLAYSHVFPGLECDETERILETHRFTGSNGVLMDLRNDDLRPDIARLAAEVDGLHFGGLPFAERHARRLSQDGRRVDLVGEGADEWLGGTTSYLADYLLSGICPDSFVTSSDFNSHPGRSALGSSTTTSSNQRCAASSPSPHPSIRSIGSTRTGIDPASTSTAVSRLSTDDIVEAGRAGPFFAG